MTDPNSVSTGERSSRERRIIVGPESLSANEITWLEFLRLISLDRDPALTLRRVQLLRRVCERRRA
jgi:hypothetical protein